MSVGKAIIPPALRISTPLIIISLEISIFCPFTVEITADLEAVRGMKIISNLEYSLLPVLKLYAARV